ncbi:MAG: hypothetical protein R2873_18040 [Caldilineaceae bacterium]
MDQRGAADVIRVGVGDVGGITPAMKTIHPVRGVQHQRRSSRWRAGQPAHPLRHVDPRALL